MSTKPIRLFIPGDAAALSVGADAVADAFRREALARGKSLQIVRNGSHGALWLEPLVEVETPEGRIGYGPVAPRDVAALLDAGMLQGAPHPLRQGPVLDLVWMKRQHRLTFERCGVIDPFSLADYHAHDGLKGLRAALAKSPAEVVEDVRLSGLRGRGGAGFPTGIKWKTVHDTPADRKYVVCNADEGDSGTFADRMLMEGDPFLLIEGMAIAAYAVGATKGFIYCRSEYPHAFKAMRRALALAEAAGILGDNALDPARLLILKSASAPAPIFAARKPRCWIRSKANAGWCAPSRLCRPYPDYSASRR
jgi:formate dehydrogenase iron-sulfur subunit